MAITSKAALEIILQAKDQASDAVSGITSKLGGLGAMAGGAALAGVAAVGAGIAAVGKKAFDFSQDVDAAMNLLQAQTGASAEEIKAFKEVALDVYAAGWGESIEDVSAAMATVNQVLDVTGEDLDVATQKAIIMRDVFGTDVAESIKVIDGLMTNLGISSDEAFDLVTAGLQSGLDVAGDFQDTLSEYSSDFARLGFDAEGMLNALNAGLEAGAYNTDVVADGMREFGIRFQAADDAVLEALDALGAPVEDLYELYEEGGITTAEVMADVAWALGEMDDKTLQSQLGAALFGTKWEDVGGDVFIAASQATDGINVLAGATDAAGESMSTGLGPALETLKRTVEKALVPVGDMLSDALEDALPFLEDAAEWLGEKIPEGVEWLKEKIDDLQPTCDWLSDQFSDFNSDLFPKLGEAWGIVTQGFEVAKDLFNEDLKPALDDLFETLGLGTLEADGLGTSLGGIVGTMAIWMAAGTIEAIRLGIEGLTWVIELVTDGIEGWEKAFDSLGEIMRIIKDVFDDVKQKISDLIGALTSLSLPDWLVPGSPTPLELGLRGISEAVDELSRARLPELSAGLNIQATPGLLAPAPLAAAGAGGEQIIIHNYFGRDSVRSDEDVLEIARLQEEALLLRGVRSFPT